MNQDELKSILTYDPLTGIFARKSTGQEGGWKEINGYRRIKINGISYRSHRLAFLYMAGEFPKNQCDHINHIRDDNRWINLRDVTHKINHKNKKINLGASGSAGIYWHNRDKRWVARIMVSYKLIHLGNFTNKDDAIQERKNAEVKYGFHENHGK